MNTHDVAIFWWFFTWFAVSVIPFYYGLKSINFNNYETKEDKYTDMAVWAICWVIAEFVGVLLVIGLSRLLKII